ncbi:MAG: sulfonate transport system permease protein [Chloroflexota bacterium]|jgi:NitT/TauT family transport system permease protein|nr:sulfonate transport system permease protein [Chloroflexota bacterium]
MAAPDRDAVTLEAGLDALELAHARRPPWWRRQLVPLTARLVAVGAVILAWQLAVALHVMKPAYLLPSPGEVFAVLVDQAQAGHLQEAIFNSLRRGAVGYAFALVFGTVFGILVSRVRLLRIGVGSLLSGLQSLPSVAWVPIGIIWFGLSDATIYFVVVMGAFPSIANGILAALDNIQPLLIRVGRSMGARGVGLYRHVIIPAAMPGYVAGLKQAWSFSWRSLMAAELIAHSQALGLGLGQMLDNGRALSDLALVLLAIFAILVVGVAIDELIFSPLETGIRRRRGLVEGA